MKFICQFKRTKRKFYIFAALIQQNKQKKNQAILNDNNR